MKKTGISNSVLQALHEVSITPFIKNPKRNIIDYVYFLVFSLLSLPKSIYFNFKCLPFLKAIHLPILVGYNVQLVGIKGQCVINDKVRPFMIRIGHGGSKTIPPTKSIIRLRRDAKIIFQGNAFFSQGTVFDVGGVLSFGKGFTSNKNVMISCEHNIEIGEDVLFGWGIHLFDNDGGHSIYINGQLKRGIQAIKIGDHVWICSYAHILKGVDVGDGSIVGYGSLVTKGFFAKNSLIAGTPASVVQSNIEWNI